MPSQVKEWSLEYNNNEMKEVKINYSQKKDETKQTSDAIIYLKPISLSKSCILNGFAHEINFGCDFSPE